MPKGEQTRERVVEQAAVVFNRQGYAGSSISDVMEATGLRKGGIYNHFESKEALAVAAFEHAMGLFRQQHTRGLMALENSVDRLATMVTNFQHCMEEPPIPGGCPLMNTAIESDDTGGQLQRCARAAMDQWRQVIEQAVRRGIARGEIQPEVDARNVATILISCLEGSLMLSKLYADYTYLRAAAAHLHTYLETQVRQP